MLTALILNARLDVELATSALTTHKNVCNAHPTPIAPFHRTLIAIASAILDLTRVTVSTAALSDRAMIGEMIGDRAGMMATARPGTLIGEPTGLGSKVPWAFAFTPSEHV